MWRMLAIFSLASVVAVSPDALVQSGNGLPDPEAFLAEARKRLAGNEVLQSRYTFRERVSQVRFNPFGPIGTGPVNLYEVYPMPEEGLTYRRLIERDGVPVPAAELAAADREYLARYHQWRRELAREGESERAARQRRIEAQRARDRARAEEAVGLFEFTLARRDTLAGQPAMVVQFRPKPDARPQSREARIAGSFAGEAWVHEHEYEVMRVDAEAVSDTTFGFGIIARLHKGAKATFRRGKIAGAWLPVESRVTGSGRAMLFRRVAINFVREYSHYRPFDPEALPSLLAAATDKR